MMGVSICRNQDLANIFYRLQLIEAYGTGMGKIMKAYEGTAKKPTIEVTQNAFKITLPNINTVYEAEPAAASSVMMLHEAVATQFGKLDPDERRVLELVSNQGKVTRKDVEDLLEVSASTASRILRRLVKGDLLTPQGKARRIKYILSK